MIPTVLTVAGSDSSGGAGIQADLKAIAACGGYGASAITAITAQNTQGVHAAEPVREAMVRAQLDAIFDDLDVRAVKTGMLATTELVNTVAESLAARRAPPRLRSRDGGEVRRRVLESDAVEAVRRRACCRWRVCSRPALEAHVLSGSPCAQPAEDAEAGPRPVDLGRRRSWSREATSKAAVRGRARHRRGGPLPRAERLPRHTHGTALTSGRHRHPLRGARSGGSVVRAKGFLTEAIRHGLAVGKGIGPTNPFWDHPRFAARGNARLGRLHVIVHPGDALARVAVEAGADIVQVRDKGASTTAQRVALVRETIAAVRPLGARVIVNDRVDVAAEAGATACTGTERLRTRVARRLWARRLVGGTANSMEEALAGRGAPSTSGRGTRVRAADQGEPGRPWAWTPSPHRAPVDKPVIAIGNITADRWRTSWPPGAFGGRRGSAVPPRRTRERPCAPCDRALMRGRRSMSEALREVADVVVGGRRGWIGLAIASSWHAPAGMC